MFWVKIRYFFNILNRTSILFEWFVAKLQYFQLLWIKTRYFSNHFECFEWISNKFRTFSAEIRYFSNVLGRNYILFECSLTNTILVERFAQKFDTFRVFWDQNQILIHCFEQNFDNFWMICSKITLFSNILSKKSILFKCFGSNKDTFRVFCVQIWIFRMFWVIIQ